MANRIFLMLVISLMVAGCARTRPVEKVHTVDKSRWSKATLRGEDGDKNLWLSKVTVVKTTENSGFAFVGMQSKTKMGTFKFTKDRLLYLNAVTPYKKEIGAQNNLINSWKVTHSQVRLAESDGKVSNREEEDPTLSWSQKGSFEIDWSGAVISEANSFPWLPYGLKYKCFTKTASALVDGSEELTKDYISFTLAVDYEKDRNCATDHDRRRSLYGDFTYTVYYKYSFKRANDGDMKPIGLPYEGPTDPDMKKYGYFTTIREYIDPEDDVFKATILMDRWAPDKTHVYYFAEDFPEEYKWVFNDKERGIFARTNALFEKNGLPIRFEVRDNDGSKKFGDIRYSFIKFIEEKVSGAPLGYGPRDANPLTGEIVAANLMMWTGSLRYYVKVIQDSEKAAQTAQGSSFMQAFANTLAQSEPSKWLAPANDLKESGSLNHFSQILPDFTYAVPQWASFSRDAESVNNSTFSRLGWKDNSSAVIEMLEPQVAAEATNLIKEAQGVASESIKNMLQQSLDPHVNTIYELDSKLTDIRSMALKGRTAQEIIDTILYTVSMHEFGHNLNLRHNFYGSFDGKNFPKASEFQNRDGEQVTLNNKEKTKLRTVPATSSVMDYLALEDESAIDTNWGPYDEAALVYAYSGRKLDLAKKRNTKYLFCTDQHVPLNVLCNRFDRGTTPSEVALSFIRSYNDKYPLRNLRQDKTYWGLGGYRYWAFSTMFQMKKFLGLRYTAMHDGALQSALSGLGLDEQSVVKSREAISGDLKNAIRLSVAFYNAVVLQHPFERPSTELYDSFSGELEVRGIFWDQYYAMYFMMNPWAFTYNPSQPISNFSYLTLSEDPQLNATIENAFEAGVTSWQGSTSWFPDMARVLYSFNATNSTNELNESLIERIGVRCYSPDQFRDRLGVDPENYVASPDRPAERIDSQILTLDGSKVTDPYFGTSQEKTAIIRYHDKLYVASQIKNPYAYRIMKNIIEKKTSADNSLVSGKRDVVFLYRTFNNSTKGFVPDCN